MKILTTPLRNKQQVVSRVSPTGNTRITAMPRAATTMTQLNDSLSPPCSCPYVMYQNLHAYHSDMDPILAITSVTPTHKMPLGPPFYFSGLSTFSDQKQIVCLLQTFPVAFWLSSSQETWDCGGLNPPRLGRTCRKPMRSLSSALPTTL